MIYEKQTHVLRDLGLTELQAIVYLAILQSPNPKATTICKTTKIARQEVYRIAEELEQKGIAFRTLSTPVEFQPIPLNEAIIVLMEKRLNNTAVLFKKIRDISKSLKPQSELGKDYFIKLIDNPDDSVYSLPLNLESARTLDLLTSYNRWEQRYKANQEKMQSLLTSKGIRIRIITEKPLASKDTSLIDFYKKIPNFQMRFTDSKPEVILGIYDGKEVLLSMMEPKSKTAFVHSNHPYFVYLGRESFERAWQKASPNYN